VPPQIDGRKRWSCASLRASPSVPFKAVRDNASGLAAYVKKCPSLAGMRRIVVQRYLMIALGGALGSMARYWVAMAVSGRVGAKVPYGTFIINMSACLAIGFSVTYLALHVALNPMWRYLVPIGFVGAFSTFSTFEWETFSTMRRGAFGFALIYAAGSFVLGLAAAWAGSTLAERLG
jgi:CrcB protein